LTSALDGVECSASHRDRFTPRERAPSTHRTGGWLEGRNVLYFVVKKRFPSPRRRWNPKSGRPTRIFVAIEMQIDGIVIWNV